MVVWKYGGLVVAVVYYCGAERAGADMCVSERVVCVDCRGVWCFSYVFGFTLSVFLLYLFFFLPSSIGYIWCRMSLAWGSLLHFPFSSCPFFVPLTSSYLCWLCVHVHVYPSRADR